MLEFLILESGNMFYDNQPIIILAAYDWTLRFLTDWFYWWRKCMRIELTRRLVTGALVLKTRRPTRTLALPCSYNVCDMARHCQCDNNNSSVFVLVCRHIRSHNAAPFMCKLSYVWTFRQVIVYLLQTDAVLTEFLSSAFIGDFHHLVRPPNRPY